MAVRNLYLRTPAEIELEIDGVREAIRLNWNELEASTLSETDRRAIRANVVRLNQTLDRLRTDLEIELRVQVKNDQSPLPATFSRTN